MDEHEQALTEAIQDIEMQVMKRKAPTPDYTRTYNRAIHHAANSIRQILEKYRGMK